MTLDNNGQSDLDRLIKLESERHTECNETEWLKWHDEYDLLKQQIEHDLKLANELKSTHNFYIKSGNGHCAGVTSQILNLSSYGGILID